MIEKRILRKNEFRGLEIAAGERWFTGDTTPLLAVEDGQTNFEGSAKIQALSPPRRRVAAEQTEA